MGKGTTLGKGATGKRKGGRKSTPGTFTPAKRTEFLERYAMGGPVARAAKAIGVSKVTVFNHVRDDAEFAAGYRRALELNLDSIEDDMHTLACNGNLTAMFGILRAKRPSVWRENQGVREAAGEFASAFAAAMKEISSGSGVSSSSGGNGDGRAARPH